MRELVSSLRVSKGSSSLWNMLMLRSQLHIGIMGRLKILVGTNCLHNLSEASLALSLSHLLFCVLRLSAGTQHMSLLVLSLCDGQANKLPIQMSLINLKH